MMLDEYDRGFNNAINNFIKNIDDAISSYECYRDKNKFPDEIAISIECLVTLKDFIIAYYINKVNENINDRLLIEKENVR